MLSRTLRPTVLILLSAFGFVEAASAYYNPRTRRFLYRDPIGEAGAVPARLVAAASPFLPRDTIRRNAGRDFAPPDFGGDDTHHGYRAVRNDPSTWLDPDGAWSIRISPCDPKYPQPEPPPGKIYDCVGLACRDYSSGRSPDDLLIKFRVGLTNCSVPCEPCEVKCWQWNYRLEVFSPSGKKVYSDVVGHTVCGQVGCNGEEPLCYNKMSVYGNLEGPKPCASFRPPASGDPIEIGPNAANGFTVQRSEFEEHCYCGPVVPPSSLPKQK